MASFFFSELMLLLCEIHMVKLNGYWKVQSNFLSHMTDYWALERALFASHVKSMHMRHLLLIAYFSISYICNNPIINSISYICSISFYDGLQSIYTCVYLECICSICLRLFICDRILVDIIWLCTTKLNINGHHIWFVYWFWHLDIPKMLTNEYLIFFIVSYHYKCREKNIYQVLDTNQPWK